jgi:hypothetical protein
MAWTYYKLGIEHPNYIAVNAHRVLVVRGKEWVAWCQLYCQYYEGADILKQCLRSDNIIGYGAAEPPWASDTAREWSVPMTRKEWEEFLRGAKKYKNRNSLYDELKKIDRLQVLLLTGLGSPNQERKKEDDRAPAAVKAALRKLKKAFRGK